MLGKYKPHPGDGIWYKLRNELDNKTECVFSSPSHQITGNTHMGLWSLYLSFFEAAKIRTEMKRKRLYYLWAACPSLRISNSPNMYFDMPWEFSLCNHSISDTFNNLTCTSAERIIMASEMLASWRVKKNGNYNNRGRSRTWMGKSIPVIRECFRQMVWGQEIQFHKNLLSTY